MWQRATSASHWLRTAAISAAGYHAPRIRCALLARKPLAPGESRPLRTQMRSTRIVNTRSNPEQPHIGSLAHGQSRRAFLRMLAAGAGVSALGTMVAACGPASPAAPAPTTANPTVTAPTAAAPATAAGATAVGAAQAGRTGGQISIQWTKPVTFNPLYSTAGSEQGVERLIYGALVRVNDKLEA